MNIDTISTTIVVVTPTDTVTLRQSDDPAWALDPNRPTEVQSVRLSNPSAQPADLVAELLRAPVLVVAGQTFEGRPCWILRGRHRSHLITETIYVMDEATRVVADAPNPLEGYLQESWTIPGRGVPTAVEFAELWREWNLDDQPAAASLREAQAWRKQQDARRFGGAK